MIYQVGAPVLRQIAQPVLEIPAPSISAIAESMLRTVKQQKGMGIAAPQLGYGLQMLVISSHPNERYPHAPAMEPIVLINPQLLAHSLAVVSDWEGCLSVPNQRGQVSRYQWVEVTYADACGQTHREVLTDFVARIFQHEFDHLQGKLFIDRAEPNTLVSEAKYRQLVSNRRLPPSTSEQVGTGSGGIRTKHQF